MSISMTNIAAMEATIRKLVSTSRRQQEALDATEAQLAVFRDLLQKANQIRDEEVKKSGLQSVKR